MARIDITQVISRIGSTARQKKNLDALGLRKLNQTVTHEDSPIIMGMVEKVKHLVVVAPAKEEAEAKSASKAAPAAEVKAEAPEAVKAAPKAEKAPAKKTAPATEKKAPAKAAAKPAAKKSVKPATEKKDGTK